MNPRIAKLTASDRRKAVNLYRSSHDAELTAQVFSPLTAIDVLTLNEFDGVIPDPSAPAEAKPTRRLFVIPAKECA